MNGKLEEYKRLVKLMPGNVVVYYEGVDGKINRIHYSAGVPNMCGFESDEYENLTKENPFSLVFEEDMQVFTAKMEEAALNNADTDIIFRLRHKTLGFIWTHCVAKYVDRIDERAVFIATLLDVTHEMQNSYGIMEASDNAICVIEKDNKRLLYGNENFYKLIKMERSESNGVYCYDALCGNKEFMTNNNCLCFSTINIDKPFEYYNDETKQYMSMYGRDIVWGEHEAYVFFLTDNTGEKYKEFQLKNAQERFNVTLDNSGLFIWEYDIQKNQCINSEKAVRDYGIPLIIENYPESLYEMGHTPPETVEQIKEVKKRLLNGETGFSVERRTIDVNGDSQWMKVEYSLQKDDKGKPLRALICGTDITERKLLEDKYAEQIAYRNNLSKNALLSMRVDMDDEIILDYTSINQIITDVVSKNVSATVVLKNLCSNIKYLKNEEKEGDICFNVAELRRSFEYGDTIHSVRYHCNVLDRVLNLTVTLTRNPNNKHIEAFYIYNDITAEYTTRMALQSIIDYDYDFVSVIDIVSNTFSILTNGQEETTPKVNYGDYEKLYKIYVERLKPLFYSKTDFDNMNTEMNIENIKRNLEKDDVHEFNITLKDKDGNPRFYRMRLRYIDDKKEKVFLTRNNITKVVQEQKEIQEKLSMALDEAKKANQAKTRFLSTVSHDMRTPMNGILGVAELMKEMDEVDELHENVEQILLSGQYLLRLINDTLDMNKIEAGELKLRKSTIFIENVLQNIIMQASMIAKDKNIELIVHKADEETGKQVPVFADQARLEQVFMNVISNAIKYTHSGGIVSLDCVNIKKSDTVIVDRYIIKDNGIGMSKEFIPHIYESFKQEGRTHIERQNGTGLGMSIVKQLIDMMNGSIEINSVINEGTEVIIEMPYEISNEQNCILLEQEVDASLFEGKKVLMCEDHPLNVKIAAALMEKKGLSVTVCENGKQGVDTFSREPDGTFDLIFMDIRMPVMDGITATKEIRKMTKSDARSIPIIAITANAFDDDVKECKDAGMNEHIAKPYKPQVLYNIIAKYIGNKNV